MMNDRPNANSHPAHLADSAGMSLLTRARYALLLLLTCFLLAACWGEEEPTPADAPLSVLPTQAVAAEDTAVPTNTTEATTAAAATGMATLIATPVAAAAVTTPTVPVASSIPTAVPLEADQASDCEIESSLDLAGYPNLEERLGCPTEPAINDPIAINEFGPDDQPTDRFMLWFSHETAIYVLRPDGTYETHEDTWVEGVDPTYPCNPLGGEEDSPPLPRRGFGKLWCSSEELQEVMGTVPREERLCQYAVLQRFEDGRLLACFEDATIRYFRLLDDGTWDLQTQ